MQREEDRKLVVKLESLTCEEEVKLLNVRQMKILLHKHKVHAQLNCYPPAWRAKSAGLSTEHCMINSTHFCLHA